MTRHSVHLQNPGCVDSLEHLAWTADLHGGNGKLSQVGHLTAWFRDLSQDGVDNVHCLLIINTQVGAVTTFLNGVISTQPPTLSRVIEREPWNPVSSPSGFSPFITVFAPKDKKERKNKIE